jgi:hypothetical protein
MSQLYRWPSIDAKYKYIVYKKNNNAPENLIKNASII